MRNRFDQQMELGRLLISETRIPTKSRDDIPALVITLLHIYNSAEYSSQVYDILEEKILKGKKRTGRIGLNLWQIFVLAELRLGAHLDYDRLHYMVETDSTIRQLLGIETKWDETRVKISYQRIVDNVSLLDDDTMRRLNEVIVSFGHNKVFKKKEAAPLILKTDSYVVESNVHFPTDYNLLLDCSRKSADIIKWFKKKHPQLGGCRKIKDWYISLKRLSRIVGQVSGKGGKNKEERLKKVVTNYIAKARKFSKKLKEWKEELPLKNWQELIKRIELEEFICLLDKQIDLLERRVLKGEQIPHGEKLFSIFEQYTEWINKGKKSPRIELGKRLSITTDQYGLIVDYEIQENRTDSEIVLDISCRVTNKYGVKSWSFDKGYWNKDIKDLLDEMIETVVMPKKGKRNKKENEEETAPAYKKLRNKHSAVESNINELEHRGLNRCPDKGYHAYKRYIGMGVVAFNLHKIGKRLLTIALVNEKKEALKKKMDVLKKAA